MRVSCATAAFLSPDKALNTAFEEELPEGEEELAKGLRHERARVRVLQAEVQSVRQEADDLIERMRRGADRGLREMQSEVARLHRSQAEMREAVQAAEGRAKGEEGFRRRAEQGWLAAQQTLEKAQAEVHQGRVQAGELEGRLAAAAAVSEELERAKAKISSLETNGAQTDGRMAELLAAQKLNSQHVAAAMGAAQQQAASDLDRAQAEHVAAIQQTESARHYWRGRAEKATARCHAAAAALAASRSSLESMLSRLVTATSVADLADQSRILFEVKAAVIDVEDKLRRPDSSGGPPDGGDAKAGRGARPKGGGAQHGAQHGVPPSRPSPAAAANPLVPPGGFPSPPPYGGGAYGGGGAAGGAYGGSTAGGVRLQLPTIGGGFATAGQQPPGGLYQAPPPAGAYGGYPGGLLLPGSAISPAVLAALQQQLTPGFNPNFGYGQQQPGYPLQSDPAALGQVNPGGPPAPPNALPANNAGGGDKGGGRAASNAAGKSRIPPPGGPQRAGSAAPSRPTQGGARSKAGGNQTRKGVSFG